MNQDLKDIYQRAINPNQYDLPDIDWEKEGSPDKPTRPLHFNYYLFKNMEDLNGKSCLDIGCGTGYLFKEFIDRGAKDVVGIEPSKRNIELARKIFPQFDVEKVALDNYKSKKQFDIVTVIMVFEHIKEPGYSFKKIKDLLKPGGSLYLIVADFNYWQKPKHGYEIKIKNLKKDEKLIAIKRHYGLLVDLIRPIDKYVKLAQKAGFKLEKHVEMKFTNKMINAVPRYKESKGWVVTHLLIFRS